MVKKRDACKKCGNCCEQGGPALHERDLRLVRDGKIPISRLVTIRKGELTHNPVSGAIQPADVELIKITGKGGRWECRYFDKQRGCTIYADRPQACVLLKCWDTEDILKLVGRETLNRFDILGADHSMVPVIKEHERIFPYPDLMYISKHGNRQSAHQLKELEQQVREDLSFRIKVIRDFDLKLSEELFYFGRPLFQLLQPLGAIIRESQSGVTLSWKI